MSTARRSTSLQQYRTEHRLSSRRAVGLIRTRTNRPSNEPNGERALQNEPDASRQRRSTPGGINAATTDSSACNKQPTPQFSTAGANYQGKKIEKIEHDNLHQPVDGSSNHKRRIKPTTIGRRSRLWNPNTLTTTSPTSHVTRQHREDRATSRGAGAQDIQQQHRT